MRDLLAKIGRRALYTDKGLEFEVEITDARAVFGRIDYKVRPVAGSGEKWVSSESVREVK